MRSNRYTVKKAVFTSPSAATAVTGGMPPTYGLPSTLASIHTHPRADPILPSKMCIPITHPSPIVKLLMYTSPCSSTNSSVVTSSPSPSRLAPGANGSASKAARSLPDLVVS